MKGCDMTSSIERHLPTTATTVGVIGTGAIGSAVARVLLRAGCPVLVWNRSPERAAGVVEAGAVLVGSPAEIMTRAELIIACLTDYGALDDVLDGVAGDHAASLLVVLTTGSPAEAEAAARRAATLGIRYVDGGVQYEPAALGTAAGTLLMSGSESGYRQHADVLRLLGTVEYLGADPAAASVWDLALFGVWYDAQLGLLRALDAAARAGSDVARFARAAALQVEHVSGSAAATASEVMHRTHPRGPASLVEHLPVLDRLLQLRSGAALGAGGLAEVRAVVGRLVDAGRGREGLTAVLDGTS
jgi:3-hydroxyisobutyrate dehydrogenase-like beta-hydroxyacid dehydrogenase